MSTVTVGGAVRLSQDAQLLGHLCRQLGLVPASFRSPPPPGLTRSLRRRADGGYTVSLAVRDRPWEDVLADMIEGVVAGNRLPPTRAASVRSQLTDAMGS